jgi:hypothetical protein
MAKQRDRRTRKQRAKPRPRAIIGTSAYFDTDPDLVEWWQGLPEGQGSEILRQIIRAHIAAQAATEGNQILALLHNLARDVKGISQQLRGAVLAAPTPSSADEPILSEEQQEQILGNVLKNDW